MTRQYNKSKSNKYKVTQSDIDNDNINNVISDTTSTDIDNNDTESSVLPDIVLYSIMKDSTLTDYLLDDDMIGFLRLLSNNNKIKANPIKIALWREQNKLFDECINNFAKIQMDTNELKLIIKEDKSDNIEMFTMKKWKPEYRDNAVQSIDKAVIINVRLDNADTIAKMVTDVTEQAKEMIDDHNNGDA